MRTILNRKTGAATSGTPRRRLPIVAAAIAAILSAALALGVFLPDGLLAKYVSRHRRDNEMIAAGFHISSDALAETTQNNTAVCGVDGTFGIDLYNYELENTDSVSEVDISYQVSVTGGGVVSSVTSGGSAVTATGGVYILQKGPAKRTHTLAIQPHDGASTLTVTVTTTAPYEKTLSATFDVTGGGIAVTKTEVAGAVTRLTIETNQYEGQITLKWPEGAYPSAGVVETAYGWRVGYDAGQAVLTANKETTYYFEFSNSTISNAAVSYVGPGYTGAVIQIT